MLGTLNGALAVRGIDVAPENIGATVEGVTELRDGMVTLTRIMVHYTLVIPPGTREPVDRALSRHREKCPTAMSLRGAVEVKWSADVREAG
jgi:organic hydroperoxide reductase OsmC/OhrA